MKQFILTVFGNFKTNESSHEVMAMNSHNTYEYHTNYSFQS